MNWIMSLLLLCHGKVRSIWNLEWGPLRPDVSDNRIQLSNITAGATHNYYEYKLHSRTIDIDCILISRILTEKFRLKSQIEHRPYPTNPNTNPAFQTFEDSILESQIKRSYRTNSTIESRSRFGFWFDYQTIRTPVLHRTVLLLFYTAVSFNNPIGIGKML